MHGPHADRGRANRTRPGDRNRVESGRCRHSARAGIAVSEPITSALDALSREELIARARELSINRPELMTRVELRDEIIRVTETDEERRKRARGWLGVARDLVASVVEQRLNLPDAAELIRGANLTATRHVPPVATVTLAEIYAAQGHIGRAIKLLDEVLLREPDHKAAALLRESLREQQATSKAEPAVRQSDMPEPLGEQWKAEVDTDSLEPWSHAPFEPDAGTSDTGSAEAEAMAAAETSEVQASSRAIRDEERVSAVVTLPNGVDGNATPEWTDVPLEELRVPGEPGCPPESESAATQAGGLQAAEAIATELSVAEAIATEVAGVEAMAAEAISEVAGAEAMAAEAISEVAGVEAMAAEAITEVAGAEAMAAEAITEVAGAEAIAAEAMAAEVSVAQAIPAEAERRDEVLLYRRSGSTVICHWTLQDDTWEQPPVSGSGEWVVRAFEVRVVDGPLESTLRDLALPGTAGEALFDVEPQSEVRLAVGWKTPSHFQPVLIGVEISGETPEQVQVNWVPPPAPDDPPLETWLGHARRYWQALTASGA